MQLSIATIALALAATASALTIEPRQSSNQCISSQRATDRKSLCSRALASMLMPLCTFTGFFVSNPDRDNEHLRRLCTELQQLRSQWR